MFEILILNGPKKGGAYKYLELKIQIVPDLNEKSPTKAILNLNNS